MNQLKNLLYQSIDVGVGNSKVFVFGSALSALGVVLSGLLGGWDQPLKILVTLIVVDYVTGVLGAIRNKKLNSEVMYWGGIRKGIVLVVIILAAMLDNLVGGDSPIFRTGAVYFYASREGLSVIENLGMLGIPLPPQIKNALEQLNLGKNKKGGKKDE
jgi:toxin secretion/phage lysis holin